MHSWSPGKPCLELKREKERGRVVVVVVGAAVVGSASVDGGCCRDGSRLDLAVEHGQMT